jgi:uncharacterized protein YgbK (DUF1537 family)
VASGDIVQRSDDLDRRLAKDAEQIRELLVYGQQNRRLIRLLAISIAFDVMLTVAGGFLAFTAHMNSDLARQATSSAAQTQQSQHTACLSGNNARATEIQLWNYILGLVSQTPQTPAQLSEVDQLRRYLASTFAPRNCS